MKKKIVQQGGSPKTDTCSTVYEKIEVLNHGGSTYFGGFFRHFSNCRLDIKLTRDILSNTCMADVNYYIC